MAQGLWFLPHGPLDRLAWRENGYVEQDPASRVIPMLQQLNTGWLCLHGFQHFPHDHIR